MRLFNWAVVGVLVLVAAAVRADEWTIDDIVGGESASGLAMSPDGAWGAWVQSELTKINETEEQTSALYLASMRDGKSRRLTHGAGSAWSAKFSPDSKQIAFLSDRAHPSDKKAAGTQVWVIPVDGGEARCVTALSRDIMQFEWCGGGDALVVLAQEAATSRETTLKEAKDTAIVVENPEDAPRTRLFRVETESGKSRRITENAGWIKSFAVSPDGERAAVIEQTSLSAEFDEKTKPRLMMADLTTGDLTPIMPGEERAYAAVTWDPDDRGFYYEYLHSTHPIYTVAGVMHLGYYDFQVGRGGVINDGLDLGYIRDIDAHRGGVAIVYEVGTRTRLARLTRSDDAWESRTTDLTDRGIIEEIACPADGPSTMLVCTSSAVEPQTIWQVAFVRNVAGTREHPNLTTITELNKKWRERGAGRVEVISWEGALGERIEGVLHYPLGYEEGTKYPLILAAHGGPLWASRDEWASRWAYPFLMWRQRGAFVLEPNYHGSSGYGQEFAESIGQGKYLTIDVEDCEKGVDHVIGMGLADPDRLAIAGWSNGAILGAAMLVRSDRWKAASLGAGDVEFISDWGNVDFGASFDNYFFLGPPWEQLDLYIERSVLFQVDRIATPTLVMTGTEDRNVPPGQSWSLFRALQQIGMAPTRLVLFPGEPHTLQKIAHQRRKIEEELAWFDRFLFAKVPDSNGSVPDASPLAALLERSSAHADDGWSGLTVNGVFIPEFVEFGGLHLSRFEITNGQWLSFDPTHNFGSLEADEPVTGVPFAEALRYAAWLSGVLGREVRLPTVEEARALGEEAGAWSGGGNTLDAWAGYSVTPDDRDRLARVLAALPAGALLRPVGSMTGRGEKGAMVFDLDGNAAEWAVGAEGAGEVVGPSADRPGDARDRRPTANPAYIGVRVILGK